ncbi:site-2 protease family protein [Pelodictyon luteolum]|uniref:Zinc protease, putative n=1 Tax=Chlorobium luteolum (strain DSM 273 / BCRC 81028 / 2530) TaxID=319225 RepID=Q3B2A2_CHLL3|nr:site-2 protease family protein [Pelodictyon luteolum]ABB24529.1 zinc protease, putative [Pelodictyon luteolum DSM 273]
MKRTGILLLHIGLFLLTLITTLWAGVTWQGGVVHLESLGALARSLTAGAPYAFGLIIFLSVHEFGHYFASMRHGVQASLPFYIPVPPLPFLLSLGTMGAVIKIRDRMPGTRALFDIGAAGPLSGFAVSLVLLAWGFGGLPPEPAVTAPIPLQAAGDGRLVFGKNLIWILMERAIAPESHLLMSDLPQYPLLFTGWIGTFVTALNLLPAGQLDGGHVTYSMFGRRGHTLGARATLVAILLLGLPSSLDMLLPAMLPHTLTAWSWPGWMLWAAILWKIIGTGHPPTMYDQPLDTGRHALGWLTILLFLISFTPVPFTLT